MQPRAPGRLGQRGQHRRRRRDHSSRCPDRFLRATVDFDLPAAGAYATGIAFLPAEPDDAAKAVADARRRSSPTRACTVLGWRDVPTDDSMLGATAASAMPIVPAVVHRQGRPRRASTLDRWAYIVRKRGEHEVGSVYFPSLSSRTLVYKGMLTTPAARGVLPGARATSGSSRALALVHSRFSTNTFPSWPLAHPYRYLAHNGEINTLKGNRNWMRAREALLASDLFPGDLDRIFPICTPDASDTATFDEVLELLAPRRPLAAARGAHDDPGGVGEPRRR